MKYLTILLPMIVACGTAATPTETPTPAPVETVPAEPAPEVNVDSVPEGHDNCTTSADCDPGEECAGEAGCDTSWTCQPMRPCTRDLVQYCSCAGETVSGSGSCPPEPYQARGACP